MIKLCKRHTDKLEKTVTKDGKKYHVIRCAVCQTARLEVA